MPVTFKYRNWWTLGSVNISREVPEKSGLRNLIQIISFRSWNFTNTINSVNIDFNRKIISTKKEASFSIFYFIFISWFKEENNFISTNIFKSKTNVLLNKLKNVMGSFFF